MNYQKRIKRGGIADLVFTLLYIALFVLIGFYEYHKSQ